MDPIELYSILLDCGKRALPRCLIFGDGGEWIVSTRLNRAFVSVPTVTYRNCMSFFIFSNGRRFKLIAIYSPFKPKHNVRSNFNVLMLCAVKQSTNGCWSQLSNVERRKCSSIVITMWLKCFAFQWVDVWEATTKPNERRTNRPGEVANFDKLSFEMCDVRSLEPRWRGLLLLLSI